MTSRLFILLFTLTLVSCFPKVENDLDKVDASNEGGETLGGAASLVITSADLDGSDYPLAVKATVIATAGSQYEIKLGDQIVESGNMPVKPKPQGPFSGISDGNNERWVFFVIGESGRHTVTLTETLNGEVETDTALVTIGDDCEENTDFFENESALSSANFSCTGSSCHSGTAFDLDTSNFDSLKVSDIFGRSTYMNFAHMPAELDVTPYAVGGKLDHTGDVKWQPGTATHFRAMETAYRAVENFTCS
jgi:hypothetical protein